MGLDVKCPRDTTLTWHSKYRTYTIYRQNESISDKTTEIECFQSNASKQCSEQTTRCQYEEISRINFKWLNYHYPHYRNHHHHHHHHDHHHYLTSINQVPRVCIWPLAIGQFQQPSKSPVLWLAQETDLRRDGWGHSNVVIGSTGIVDFGAIVLSFVISWRCHAALSMRQAQVFYNLCLDLSKYISRFPQWSQDIGGFLIGLMRSVTSRLACLLRSFFWLC